MHREHQHAATRDGSPIPRALINATPTADIVSVPKRRCLAIDGAGSPHEPAFQQAVGTLFGIAYALKLARKRAGKRDFKIGPLEGHWSEDAATGEGEGPPAPEHWRWRLRIGVPEDATREDLMRLERAVVCKTATKKGGKLHRGNVVEHVFLESVPAQRLGRILHVGPYAGEPASFARIAGALERAGLTPAPTHIEVYRSDPRKTRTATLETVLLRELARA
jgi:hypothetical protein